MEIKKVIFKLSEIVIKRVHDNFDVVKSKRNTGLSGGGDTQFDIDDIAEKAVEEYLRSISLKSAYYSEDGGLIKLCPDPQYVFVIDPIDGTRGAAAGLECCCFSVAVARYTDNATINDIEYAMLYEFKSQKYFYSDYTMESVETNGVELRPSMNLSTVELFWSMEFNGHPAKIITEYLGELIDATANKGAVFIFNSSTYSISRIFTGQLDAYIDIGNKILRDCPKLESEFRKVGNGKILHLFPYDIAAAVYLAKKVGIAITDAYGKDLGLTKLMDINIDNLQSCVAAANWELHQKLMNQLDGRGIKNEEYSL